MALNNNSYFTFLLTLCYSLLLVFHSCFDSLEVVWVLIELLTFLFIGLIYVSTNSSVAIFNGGVYFITQSMLSMVLLVILILVHFSSFNYSLYSLLLILVVIMNIGVFPFSGWYQSSVYSLPILPFFLALTFHKIPLLYLINLTIGLLTSDLVLYVMLFILLVNLFIFGGIANFSSDLRSVILCTSIANNVWLILSSFGSLELIVSFVTVYYVLILTSFSNNLVLSNWSLIAISGLPPFPMFFLKFLVLWGFLSSSFFLGYVVSIVLITFTLLVSFSYLRFTFSRFMLS